jgi:tripartite-type tricarboxylate transporter receptor subunit TctC
MTMPFIAIIAIALHSLLLSFSPAQAAPLDACRTITFVVAFPPGSTTDSVSRLLSDKVSETLGRPVVVENKPGADGQVAAQDVMRAPPDGCRLMLATSGGLSIVPFLRKEKPYDPSADFTAIADVGRYQFFFYVPASLGVNTMQAFSDLIKKNPGRYNYAVGNNTGLLSFNFARTKFDWNMQRVNYRGEPPGIVDMLADRVHAIVATGAHIPQVKDGKLRALAVVLDERSELLPEVPTYAEIGLGDFEVVLWLGVVGPPKMPRDTVELLSAAFVKAMGRDDVKSAATRFGFAITPSGPDAFAKLIAEQTVVYGVRIREAGLTPE